MRVALLVLGFVVLVGACDGSGPPAPPLDPSAIDPGSGSQACAAFEVHGATAQRFEVDGSCVPGDVLVLYRCAPTAVPVLRISSVKGPALFLGGPFAVPVSSLPAQVRFAGAAGGTEVLIADPLALPTPTPAGSSSIAATPSVEGAPIVEPERLVYVREEGRTERWLQLEGRRALHDPPIVWIIGDSIMDGGREEVEAALADWSLSLDAEVGRSSSSGVELARAAVEQDADAVVIELGTNDTSPAVFRAHLVETLDTLAAVPLVIWQTARGPEDDLSIPEVNAAIREVAPTYSNVSIADWTAFVPDEAVQTDGIHPDEGFQELEAELLVPFLSEWRDALDRRGATTCGREIVRETS
ncbi:MAG TPA: GDSL-type esterase/lipase family protein [Actinomycetota bacterium]|nr:GDSL-type esterase/lipase family protein [Actinomycetota bacterium]